RAAISSPWATPRARWRAPTPPRASRTSSRRRPVTADASGNAATDPVQALAAARTVHVMGVGGGAMSALADALVGMGKSVTGCDVRESAVSDRLRAVGVEVRVGHDPAHLDPVPGAVVVSTAIPRDHAEVARARALAVPVLTRADAQRAILASRRA